jgi:hypothetical protein
LQGHHFTDACTCKGTISQILTISIPLYYRCLHLQGDYFTTSYNLKTIISHR